MTKKGITKVVNYSHKLLTLFEYYGRVHDKEEFMVKAIINSIVVLFSKFFGASDAEKISNYVADNKVRSVLFIDTPATSHLVELVESLTKKGIKVVVRDHHNVLEPRGSREQEVAEAVLKLKGFLDENSIISDRGSNPACSGLVEVGEFSDFDLVIADPDPDGLLGSMKALGILYPELDADADILDGPRSAQTADNLSEMAMLLVKGMATLPPFNPTRPEFSQDAKGELFQKFSDAVQGDAEALDFLKFKVEAFEASVAEAKRLAETTEVIAPGVVLCDVTGAGRFHLTTLSGKMESVEGCKITVVRKNDGPIAAVHGGVQYSLAVKKGIDINLQDLLPAGFISSPEAGIISNTSFLLHVSENIWQSVVLSALRR